MAILGYFWYFVAIPNRFQHDIICASWIFSVDLAPILVKPQKSFSHTFLNKMGFSPKSDPVNTPQKMVLTTNCAWDHQNYKNRYIWAHAKVGKKMLWLVHGKPIWLIDYL